MHVSLDLAVSLVPALALVLAMSLALALAVPLALTLSVSVALAQTLAPPPDHWPLAMASCQSFPALDRFACWP